MQVRLTTTISTIIEITPGVSVEEAKGEILGRYDEDCEQACEEVLLAQNNAITFDQVIGTEVSHSFAEVK